MKRTTLALPALALLALGFAVPGFASPQLEIQAKLYYFGLGRPRADTPQPVRTPPPRDWGYYQLFEYGSTYWSPRNGAHVVRDPILARWADQGYEQGPLGFPLTDEIHPPPPNRSDRYQCFEGGTIYWYSQTNKTEVRPGDRPSDPTPARARFRVSLNGFYVNRETADDPLERDGAGDEVFVVPATFGINALGRTEALAWRTDVTLLGQTRDDLIIEPAGSRTDRGGLQTGDAYPTSPPWVRSRPFWRGAPPQVLFEGELVRGEIGTIVAPTIWEWDGNSELQGRYYAEFEGGFGRIRDTARRVLLGLPVGSSGVPRRRTALDPEWLGAMLSAERGLLEPTIWGDGFRDRPIGMVTPSGCSVDGDNIGCGVEDPPESYVFRLQGLILTYDNAGRAADTDRGWGPGVLAIRYQDDAQIQGDYTLFLQIERLP
jgi:hypothetical protein